MSSRATEGFEAMCLESEEEEYDPKDNECRKKLQMENLTLKNENLCLEIHRLWQERKQKEDDDTVPRADLEKFTHRMLKKLCREKKLDTSGMKEDLVQRLHTFFEGSREQFVKEQAFQPSECESFDDMDLDDDILRGIYSYGYEIPRPLQQRVITSLVNGRDMVCQARSGTGKTAAFIIGALERIDSGNEACQVLVLAPTRERAFQIQRVALELSRFLKVKCYLCIGGRAMRDDIAHFLEGQHIVIGTPGRVYHLMTKRYMTTDALKMLVIDEADQMLPAEMCPSGYKDEVHNILNTVYQRCEKVQVCIFTGAMTQDIQDISNSSCRPFQIIVEDRRQLTLEGTRQYHFVVQDDAKLQALCDLLRILEGRQSIIYCSTRRKADYIRYYLSNMDWRTSVIHADLDQENYDSVIRNFRSGSSQILLSSGLVASGGLVRQVTMVINYDFPYNMESYFQRVGCSGRLTRKGMAISFVTTVSDMHVMKRLEDFHQIEIPELPLDIEEEL